MKSPSLLRNVPAHRRQTIADVRVHYRVAGHGRRGTPVLCVAAPGDSSGSLVPLLRSLGQRRLAFALDLPGHGRSGNPPYGRRDPAWWLIAWLERMGFEHCHLVVVDGSAGVGLDTAQRSARHVRSLSLIAPPSTTDKPLVSHIARGVLAAPHTPRTTRVAGSLLARARSMAAHEFVAAMHPRQLERDTRHAKVPILVVRGEHDSICTRDEATALARLAHGTYTEIPTGARNCQLSNAGAVVRTLESFWLNLDGGTGITAQPQHDNGKDTEQ